MAERKWALIASGATFESLATTIVFFEDPTAVLFGRSGKDGGQDVRSGDGTRVYQAKHHVDCSAAKAIADAKGEATKLHEYRQPGHPRHAQWAGVTHWKLVTNAAFNPTDRQAWDTDVVPIFAAQGLTAEVWTRADLNTRLDKHPEIHRSFFENEPRAFLSISEAREALPAQEPFLRRDSLAPFHGRQSEMSRIGAFLRSSHMFLVVHGAGGLGKTRLLVEAGEELANAGHWQVLWANVATMTASGSWFDAVVPERPTVLLVDEPTDEPLLQQLAEQLGNRVGRTAQWKVVVAVRSPKDPVLRFLRGARMKARVEELAVGALSMVDAEAMCFDLLGTGTLGGLPVEDRRNAAHQLSERFSRHPVWLTLAVQHLEDHKNLKQIPLDARLLAEEYLREIEQSQSDLPPESVRDLLRWVALIGAVNREDDSTMRVIGEGCGVESLVEVRARLSVLVKRRVLVERGARSRFVELKPDVLRDRVLLDWLTTEIGHETVVASDAAESLLDRVRVEVMANAFSKLGRATLAALARTEFLLRLSGYHLRLLDVLFESLEAAASIMAPTQRIAVAAMIELVAPFRPREAAALIGALRRTNAPDEIVDGVLSTKVVRHADVILSLAWPLFHAAMGAETAADRETVLRELCAIAAAEAELAPHLPRGLPNDGRRAAALVTRALEGGPQFLSDFDETGMHFAVELLKALAAAPPTLGQLALLNSLVAPTLSLERRQSWADERTFTWRTFAIAPGSSAWLARAGVLAELKIVLEAGATPVPTRAALWHIYARVHDGTPLEKLRWTHEVLTKRATNLQELVAAREVWEWYRRFEKEPDVKAAADALEQLYTTNDLAAEFEPLFSYDDLKEHELRIVSKAAALSATAASQEIHAFVDRAVSFLGQEHKLYSLSGVAWNLGQYAEDHEPVREFVLSCLQQSVVSPRTDFGVAAAVRWAATIRLGEHPEQAHALVKHLLEQCGSDDQRANLLQHVYGRVPKLREVGEFTPEEHDLLRGSASLFIATHRAVPFVAALALSVRHQWTALRPLLAGVLREIDPERLPQAMYALVDAVYWAVREVDGPPIPADLSEWLMTQLLALPDFDDLGGNGEWHLTELLKHVGRVDIHWLIGALATRRAMEAKSEGRELNVRNRAVGYQTRISKFVKQLVPEDLAQPKTLGALENLLDFVHDSGTVGYYLPQIVRDVDPEGLATPARVATRAERATSAETIRRLARIAGAYALNGSSWRTIATATVRAGSRFGAEGVRSVYGALNDRGIRSWSAPVGEVALAFQSAVDEARATLANEALPDLREFWEQRLAAAEADFRDEEERAREERGE